MLSATFSKSKKLTQLALTNSRALATSKRALATYPANWEKLATKELDGKSPTTLEWKSPEGIVMKVCILRHLSFLCLFAHLHICIELSKWIIKSTTFFLTFFLAFFCFCGCLLLASFFFNFASIFFKNMHFLFLLV